MFFSRHKQGWIPYHIQLYIFYIMIWSQIWNIESSNLYVCTFSNTYKKGKIPDSNMLCNFKRYKKARVSSVHCFGAEVYISMIFMARLDGLRFCRVVACITFYQCYKRNRESILRTERRLAFAIFNTNFPMHFSVFLGIFNTSVQTEPWSKYWGINNFRPENDAVFSNCHVEGIINSSM